MNVPTSPVSRTQAGLLRFGAAFDAAFGLAMLLAPERAARFLGIDLPDERLWFALSGLLLLILATIYVAAAVNPARHVFALVAGLGRLAGSALLIHMSPGLADGGGPFLAAGCVDGVLGGAHLGVALAHRLGSGGWGMVGARSQDRT